MRFAFLFTTLVLLGTGVEAQIDPSSAMLLNSSRTPVRDGGLDSGRYTVKPKSEVFHSTTAHKVEVKNRVEDVAPAPSPMPPSETAETDSTSSSVPVSPPTAATSQERPSSQKVGPQQVSTSDEADDDEDTEIEEPVVAKIPRDERRFTMLELSFAPGYLYNNSQSTFSPRNYFVNAPTMNVDASVWTSPNFGVHTNFNGSLNANVSDSSNNTRNASVSEQWFSAGARARSFFGDGPWAPTLQFGIDYREFEFRLPSDTLLRNKLTTTGLLILLDAEIPTRHFGSWILGGEFGPKLSHRESSNAIEFRSGDDPQTTSVGMHFGSKFRFDHTQSIFWKISYGIEKNLFSGTTTVNDPVTGLPQTNVSVTDSFSLFQLGYTWSN
jgi:hypothetical protein